MLTCAHSDDSNNDAGTHYLTNTVDDLDRDGMEGAKYMHSPAPRTKEDHASLWHHIRTGTLGMSVGSSGSVVRDVGMRVTVMSHSVVRDIRDEIQKGRFSKDMLTVVLL